MSELKLKNMLVVFFEANSVIHKQLVPPGQTVNAAYYVNIFEKNQKKDPSYAKGDRR